MAARIVLSNGQVVTGPIDPAMIPGVSVARYVSTAALAERLREWLTAWTVAAGEAGLETVEVDLNMIADDFATMAGISPEEWEYIDQPTNIQVLVEA